MKNSTSLVNGNKYQAVTESALKFYLSMCFQLFKNLLFIVLLFNFTLAFSSCNKNEKAVFDAYELRIQGKVDEAKEMLLTVLAEDSTNALAHYELARTLNYMSMRGSDEATKAIQLALKYDPQNVIYAYANAKNCFLQAYIAMHDDGSNTKDLVDNVCMEFVKVLEMKSDYPEALMYLVEIYGMLPEEMGGDKTKAEEYTKKLEKIDKFYGAKASLVLMPEGTDKIKYWKNNIEESGENCSNLKELGVAHIFNDNIEAAEEVFKKIIAIDPSQNIRLLDLSRFHMMKVMQNRETASEELPKSKKYLDQYLASMPAPIPPLKAYTIGMLVKIEMFSGNKEKGEELMAEAKALDPYFSRAFAIPAQYTFEPPNKLDHHFVSFFSPY